jgi:AraC family cel operon transcriptional repressor
LSAVCHAHDFYELVWVREGDALQIVNGREMPLAAGEAVLLRPGDAHRFAGQAEHILVVSLSIRREELEVMAGAYSPALAAHLKRGEPPHLPLPEANVPVRSEFDCKFILSLLLRTYIAECGFSEEGTGVPSCLAPLSAEMREHDRLRVGIPAALALSHYSQCHLARLVRAHYGMGLKAWVNDLRLQEARRELILTERGVADIADGLGFASHSHFTKIFKQKFGITPAALRKERRILTV